MNQASCARHHQAGGEPDFLCMYCSVRLVVMAKLNGWLVVVRSQRLKLGGWPHSTNRQHHSTLLVGRFPSPS